MELIQKILFACLTPVLLMVFTYWVDWRQPEPTKQLFRACLLGGVVALLSLSVSQIFVVLQWTEISDISLWSSFKHAFLGAALPEELSKLLMLWILLYNNKYFNEFLDAIIYAVFIAMGFAAVENLCYLFVYPEVWTNTAIGRSLISVPAHFCYAAVMGICYSTWRFQGRKSALWMALIVPFLLHGTFDFCLYAVSPKIDGMQLASVILMFCILFIFLLVFSVRIILVTLKKDNQLRDAIRQRLWKQPSGRIYMLAGICLTCSLLMNGESKTTVSSPRYSLSPELTEFRDAFCLPVRTAYTQFALDGDEEEFSMSLQDALGSFNANSYQASREFSMQNRRVILAPLDLIPEFHAFDLSISKDNHLCYNPHLIDSIASGMQKIEVHQAEMMYEKIHRLATDANAVAARLPLCKYRLDVLPAHSEVEFSMEADGNLELLLVSENGGNLQLNLQDKTNNRCYVPETVDGAAWIAWTMNTHGEYRVRVSNPAEVDLSYVLATVEKRN